jgi:hypothetical protein
VLSFELLDKVADSYAPLLGVTWLALVIQPAISRRWRQAFWRLALGFSTLVIAYSFMWADNAFLWWPSVGLDYSTHSAVALALAAAIGASSPRLRLPVAATVLAYFLLMLHQRYHTIADIASTSAAVAAPLAALVYALLDRVETANNSFKSKSLRGSA